MARDGASLESYDCLGECLCGGGCEDGERAYGGCGLKDGVVVKPAGRSFRGSEEGLLQVREAVGGDEVHELFEEVEGATEGGNGSGFILEFTVLYSCLQSAIMEFIQGKEL